MARIKHRANNVDIGRHKLHVLPGARSASIPAVCPVNVYADGRLNIFARVRQKRNKGAFHVHAFIAPAVLRIENIFAVGRKAYVIELNFVESAPDEFFRYGRIVFPHFFRIRIDPVFIVKKRFLFGGLAVFGGNVFVALYTDPRRVLFAVPDGVLITLPSVQIAVFKNDDARDKIHIFFLKPVYERIDIDGIHAFARLFRYERIVRAVAQKAVIVFHVYNKAVQIICVDYAGKFVDSRLRNDLPRGNVQAPFCAYFVGICGLNRRRPGKPQFVQH